MVSLGGCNLGIEGWEQKQEQKRGVKITESNNRQDAWTEGAGAGEAGN